MSHIPRPIARIPDVRFPAVPFCWRWLPPGPADWERAKANRWGPVTDPELIAFGVLVGWCRYRCSICGTSDPDFRSPRRRCTCTRWRTCPARAPMSWTGYSKD